MPARRAIVCMLALAACNYDWTYRAPDGGSATPQKDGGGNPTDDSGTAPTACKVGGEACPPNQYCHFLDRLCGTSNPEGECRDVATSCIDAPVCTCKGSTENGCIAQKNGIDIDEKGASCSTNPGEFVCGSMTCIASKEVCVTQSGSSKCVPCTDGCKCTGFETCQCDEPLPGEFRFECK